MSIREPDLASEMNLLINKKWAAYPSAAKTAELNAIIAALGTDVTTHSKVIEEPPAGLKVLHGSNANVAGTYNTPFTNDINLAINKGKAGNLTAQQIAACVDDAIGALHPPAVVDIPHAYPNGPLIAGTTCTCTSGNWDGTVTSYAYAWKHDGATATGVGVATNTYTIAAADTGGHNLTCVVSATLTGQGTTIVTSNGILVP